MDSFPQIERCFAHQVAWDGIERHAYLERMGCRTVYNDSGVLDTPHIPRNHDDLPPADSYYEL